MFGPIIDVSSWQRDIDVEKMLGQGTKAMYIKAGGTDKTNGASYTDWRFRENAKKFSEKVPVGYYYFFYPHFDGRKQAQYFCKLLNSAKWNLPPAIDVESNPNNVSKSRFQQEIKDFVDEVERQFNIKCVIYTRAMFWNAQVGNPAWAAEHKLWLALYNEQIDHPWMNKPTSTLRPKPWTNWWLWQYSADSNGKGKAFGTATSGIDINRVNMSADEFYKFAKWQQPEIEPPVETPVVAPPPEVDEPDEEPITVPPANTTVVNGAVIPYPHKGFLRAGFVALRLRSTPTISNSQNIVGAIRQGYTFTVYAEREFGDDLWWLIELPDKTVGWAARRLRGVTFLGYGE